MKVRSKKDSQKIINNVSSVIALVMIATSFLYLLLLKNIDGFMNYIIFGLILGSGILYFVLRIFKRKRIAIGALSFSSFISFIGYFLSIYNYPFNQIMEIGQITDIPYMIEIILIGIVLVLVALITNVFCYLGKRSEGMEDMR